MMGGLEKSTNVISFSFLKRKTHYEGKATAGTDSGVVPSPLLGHFEGLSFLEVRLGIWNLVQLELHLVSLELYLVPSESYLVPLESDTVTFEP
ncbi:unnamed protein product [Caenorhabditis nigoni]